MDKIFIYDDVDFIPLDQLEDKTVDSVIELLSKFSGSGTHVLQAEYGNDYYGGLEFEGFSVMLRREETDVEFQVRIERQEQISQNRMRKEALNNRIRSLQQLKDCYNSQVQCLNDQIDKAISELNNG